MSICEYYIILVKEIEGGLPWEKGEKIQKIKLTDLI